MLPSLRTSASHDSERLEMGSSIPGTPTTDVAHQTPPRTNPRPRARRRRWTPWRTVAVGVLVLLVIVGAQFAVHVVRTDPRDSRAITERELRVNTLQTGERIAAMASAFQRPAIDYFRATRGLLVLTNRRLLFLGLQPRDLLSSGEGPPTFDERDFAVDTLVHVEPARTFFGLAKAIAIDGPRDSRVYGVPSPAWHDAQILLDSIHARHGLLYAEGVRAKRARDRAEAERRAAEAEARKAQYYTVQRGDALAAIAARWSTTPGQLRAWNGLTSNTIKVGQKLLVKPAEAPADTQPRTPK